MYERMLVPLDGSEVAEAILPFAEQVAGPLDAEVVLLRVIEPPSPVELVASAGVVAPDTFTRRDVEAKAYLSEVERRLSKNGLRVRTRVALGGPPAEEILATAQATGADLIAMATHGRSGLGRALFGSVAESVLRASPVPVLVIRDGALVGIVTDRDVRHRLFAPDVYRQIGKIAVSTLLRQAPARTVMSAPVRCISAVADVAEAAERMRRDRVGCLPVVDGSRLVGMLTEIDVLRSIVGAEAPGSPELDVVISYP
jgi:nucleotide-binding universal stress UspA family protein